MSTSNDTLDTPIPSGHAQSTSGTDQNSNQGQEGQEPHYKDQHQIENQNPGQNNEEQDNPSLPGNFLAVNAVHASCNSILEDFRSS